MTKEQLDALRRQVEEDYKLDIAAIDRLQRRFQGSASAMPTSISSNISSNIPSAPIAPPSVPVNAYTTQSEWSKFESRIDPSSTLPQPAASAERQSDALEGSLRSMFSSVRK